VPVLPDDLHQPADALEPLPSAQGARSGICYAYTHTRGRRHVPSHVDANLHSDAHRHAAADGYAYRHGYAHRDRDSYIHAHGDQATGPTAHSHEHPYPDSQPDALALYPAWLHIHAPQRQERRGM
jgi:hypothetical protein